jgi:hypothetical protein
MSRIHYRYRSLDRNLFHAYYAMMLSGEPCAHVVAWYQRKLAVRS